MRTEYEFNQNQRFLLSSLRVAAAIWVFVCHFGSGLKLPRYLLLPIQSGGSWGVTIFFLLSGLLNYQSYTKSGSIRNFLKKKLLRILPLYYTVLIVNIVVFQFWLECMPKDSSHLGWLRYFLFLNSVLPSKDYKYWCNLSGFWTMPCFLFFYLVTPVICHYVRAVKQFLVVWAGAVAINVGCTELLKNSQGGGGIHFCSRCRWQIYIFICVEREYLYC